MRAQVEGTVTAVGEIRTYTRRDGTPAATVDVFLAAGDPRFAPDRISMDPKMVPAVGEDVAYLCSFSARNSRDGKAYLSVWAVERLVELDAASTDLKAAKAS